eukprot:Tamp_05305.p1 GENE.Tamp_05305~~Tamp_05305.p1  ORF type:complete len:328 (+),score=41.02 Tamp_05305:1884-2867(+)
MPRFSLCVCVCVCVYVCVFLICEKAGHQKPGGGGGGGEMNGAGGGRGWETLLDVFRKRLDSARACNITKGGLREDEVRTTRIVGKTMNEEEAMLLEAFELQMASSERRQARGLDMHLQPIWNRRGRLHASSTLHLTLQAGATASAEALAAQCSDKAPKHQDSKDAPPILVRDGTQLCARGAKVRLRDDLWRLIDTNARGYDARYLRMVQEIGLQRLMAARECPGQFFLTKKLRDKTSGVHRFLPAAGGGAGFSLPKKGVEGRLLVRKRPGVWLVTFPRAMPGEPESMEIPVGEDGLYLLQLCEGYSYCGKCYMSAKRKTATHLTATH